MSNTPEVTFLIPCLNEALSLPKVIEEINNNYAESGTSYEILVADNGSTDDSKKIAENLGARVIVIKEKGYGSALLGGIKNSRGSLIVMGDADGSYHFADAKEMIHKLRNDSSLVIGNRFEGGIEKGAMPFLHRYLGNPALSYIARLFFKILIHDFHCGLRAFRKKDILEIGLKTTGMEFASEMIVKAKKNGKTIDEVPVRLYKDLRSRPPHLRTWRDGWRHLRFLILNSPTWALKIPALFGFIFSILLCLTSIMGYFNLRFFGLQFSVKSGIFALAASIISFNLFWAFTVISEKIDKKTLFSKLGFRFLFISSLLGILLGVGIFIFQMYDWYSMSFSNQPSDAKVSVAIVGAFFLILGASTITNLLLIKFLKE